MDLEIAFVRPDADGRETEIRPDDNEWRDGIPTGLYAASLDFLRTLTDVAVRSIAEDLLTRPGDDGSDNDDGVDQRSLAAHVENDSFAETHVAPSRPYERSVKITAVFGDGRLKDTLETRTPVLVKNLVEEISLPESEAGRATWASFPIRSQERIAHSFRRLVSELLSCPPARNIGPHSRPRPVLFVDNEESDFDVSPTSIGFLERCLADAAGNCHAPGWVVGRLERFDERTGFGFLRSFETESLLPFRFPQGGVQNDIGQDVRVRGRVELDSDGRVVGIDEARGFDIMKRELSSFRYEKSIPLPNGRKLVPDDVGLHVSLDPYSRQLVVVRNRATGVEGYGPTKDEATAMFADRLACLWSQPPAEGENSMRRFFREKP